MSCIERAGQATARPGGLTVGVSGRVWSSTPGAAPERRMNVRRSIAPMFTLVAAWFTPLAAQSAISFGFAGTLGPNWQIEALEVGGFRHMGLGPIRAGGVMVRGGWFADQAAILGGTRGIVGALAVALRSGSLGLAQVGEGPYPTHITLDLSLEVGGYLGANSPLPEGKRWASVALLPAIRVGQMGGSRFALLIGPAWFAGKVRHTHAFLGVRGEFPLARGRGGP